MTKEDLTPMFKVENKVVNICFHYLIVSLSRMLFNENKLTTISSTAD